MSNIGCVGGCGATVPEEQVTSTGWSYLHITGRWRCGACERSLALASIAVGAPSPDHNEDPLPPDSIGALKKLPEPLELHEKVKP